MTKKLYVKTYGCQMNFYDSTRMQDALAPLGFVPVDTPDDADMAILNTCHIREKASEKVYSDLGRLKPFKDKKRAAGGNMVVAVAGCTAQAEGDAIMKRAPMVDIVVGPQSYHRLPELVARAARAGGKQLDTEFPVEVKFDILPESTWSQGASAFLAVQEGCDKFCTFCVVPYTRGAEYSRPMDKVMTEARHMVTQGAREITLLGQNVNAYHGAERGLGELIDALSLVDGLERIRYTTSHPRDMDENLMRAHRDNPKLMPYLHLPIQAGSDSVLDAMNRQHTADHYRRVIDTVRRFRPDIALSSDFIVGFPGESDSDFQETLRVVRDVTYASAYSFKYSPRPGTPAAMMDKQIPEHVKDARLQELQELLRSQQAAFNAEFMGRTVDVLFDRRGRHAGQLLGRTPHNQSLVFDAGAQADNLFGTVQTVTISAVNSNSFTGVRPDKEAA